METGIGRVAIEGQSKDFESVVTLEGISQKEKSLHNVWVYLARGLRPSVDDAAKSTREKQLNLEGEERGLSVVPMLP
jgi:hypothetical protein